ncbi:MAG TPA: EutN/CcmL family microcompartment protein [Atribacteraceae bacterium]|nr:EutN/CcmL family microcompartment protein [Atribacteraceae bacterium]
MILAKVTGTVVSTTKSDGIAGLRYLIVQPCDSQGKKAEEHLIGLDLVGSGDGEMVLVSQGSSARQSRETHQKAVDCVIVGIVDLIEENGQVVFRK